MWRIFATILCFFIVLVSSDIGDYDEAVRKGNDFVDKLLRNIVLEHGSEYDPYYMEDNVISFHKTVMWVNVTGEAKLHSGFIRGLTTLNRADGCHLREENDRLIIRADLGAGVLDLEYSGTVKFMSMGPTIVVHGKVDYVEVTMIMSCDADDGLNGKLQEFYIDDIKGLSVWITGLGPLNMVANAMISVIKTLFRRMIHRLVENKLENYMADKVANYQFPVESVIVDNSAPNKYLVNEKFTKNIFN